MNRFFGIICCIVLFGPGCGETAVVDSEETGSESTAVSEEASAGVEGGEESIAAPCEDVDCDDGNVCTDDSCDEVTGDCLNSSVPGRDCDDGNACSTDDVCGDTGVCFGESSLLCEDGEPCTNDLCDDLTGCVFEAVADGETCNDGDACTMVDACKTGVCEGTAKPCPDDDNPCTAASGCDEKTGECLFLNVPDETLCDDGNKCTDEDMCIGGECQSDKDTVCFDDNPCTDDLCTPKGGCQFPPNEEFCDDGTLCTTNDQCSQGQCKGEVLECDDGNQCTNDGCDPETGCDYVPVTGPCEDGNPCTLNDLCENSQCQNGLKKDCDDDDPCTEEYCNLDDGLCVYAYTNQACDDGDTCTVEDLCDKGVCKGAATLDCDDSNPCTSDKCVSGEGCVYENIGNQPCDDGDFCTEGDACVAGDCIGEVTSDEDCDDGNICTTDACVPGTGCVHPANSLACDDGDACTTNDSCGETLCIGGPALECDDDNPCTDDGCDPETGCTFLANDLACEDGDLCTTSDTCEGGICLGGDPVDCDDGNVCTVEECSPEDGNCVVEPADGPCDDGDVCTEDDACQNSGCQGNQVSCEDGDPCTSNACNPETGCLFEALTGPGCDDGNACTGEDVCTEGVCSGSSLDCDDDNACTTDSCEAGIGCIHTDNSDSCDDDNICTTDTCESDVGCINEPNANPCDDGDVCTADDTCAVGNCGGGGVANCDDDNVCTTDTCESGVGCIHETNGEDCDDGNICTMADSCVAGECLPGGPIECSDFNECTDDYCDPVAGCQYTNVSGACTDGDFCTVFDSCQEGECQSAGSNLCNDGIPCTLDSCDVDLQVCVHVPDDTLCDDGIACTVDTCDLEVAWCLNTPDDSACDSGELCITDTCQWDTGCASDMTDGCCGNGLVEEGEQCDDGNAEDGDGCSSLCLTDLFLTDCVAILMETPESQNGTYTIDPDGEGGNVPFDVWCDMDKGGWAMLLTATATGTYWGNGSPNWSGEGADTPVGYADVESHQKAFSHLPTDAIRICYQDGDHCFDFEHKQGISLQEFFTLGITYSAYSLYTIGVTDVGAVDILNNYSASLGVAIGSGDAHANDGIFCDWLGINLPSSTSSIGWMHDENAGCVNGQGNPPIMDDGAFGVGLNTCFDATGCDIGGPGNLNGSWRNAFGMDVDSNGETGPWFVLGRSIVCGDGILEEGEECDDGNQNEEDGCSSACLVEGTWSSCEELLLEQPGIQDGQYYIDPDEDGPILPALLYCDMTHGGWTLVGNYYDLDDQDDSPNSTDFVETGWQQTGSGSWSSGVTHVNLAGGAVSSSAVSIAFVEALQGASQSHLKHCFLAVDGSDGECRTSSDGSMTLVAFNEGNSILAGYSDNPLVYSFARLAGLAASVDGYTTNEAVYNAACIPALPSDQNGGYGNNAQFCGGPANPGLCDLPDNSGDAVWHGFCGGASYFPGRVGSELESNWSGFRLYIGPSSCGDGVLDPDESCDDSNLTNGDGCSSACLFECENLACDDGISCTVDTCEPTSGCVNTPEDSACSTGQLCVTDTCSPTLGCQTEATPNCCGNGIVEEGETCDGNCPTCYTSNPCTGLTQVGSAGSCDVACIPNPSVGCVGGDGCCPLECNPSNDSDCGSQCSVQIDVLCYPDGNTNVQVKALDPSFDSTGLAPPGYLSWSYNWPTWPLMPNWCLNDSGMQSTPFASSCIHVNYNNADCLPTDYSKSCQASFCYQCP